MTASRRIVVAWSVPLLLGLSFVSGSDGLLHMAKLRVRGMVKVTYWTKLRALGLNIQRVAAYRTIVG